jgi:hypothetical protein
MVFWNSLWREFKMSLKTTLRLFPPIIHTLDYMHYKKWGKLAILMKFHPRES